MKAIRKYNKIIQHFCLRDEGYSRSHISRRIDSGLKLLRKHHLFPGI
jgi:hypothetical protein